MANVDETIYNKFMEELGIENGKMIIEIFIEELNDHIIQIRNAEDYGTIQSIMHQIKSTSKTLGANVLSVKASQIEKQAKEEDNQAFNSIDEVLSEMTSIKEEFEKRRSFL